MDILKLQGVLPRCKDRPVESGLSAMTSAFPLGLFPMGIHEFVSTSPEHAAATSGFMTALLSKVARPDVPGMWFSSGRILFPPALNYYGIRPDRIIFVDVRKSADLLWMIEQALKCEALGAVVGEVKELNLMQSRRLQLAVEQSRVPCFLHRYQPRVKSAVASVCRWKVKPTASRSLSGMPGVGFPVWEVTLDKVRNGHSGSWKIQWVEDHFEEEMPYDIQSGTMEESKVFQTG